jgi:hypothetical protein
MHSFCMVMINCVSIASSAHNLSCKYCRHAVSARRDPRIVQSAVFACLGRGTVMSVMHGSSKPLTGK